MSSGISGFGYGFRFSGPMLNNRAVTTGKNNENETSPQANAPQNPTGQEKMISTLEKEIEKNINTRFDFGEI